MATLGSSQQTAHEAASDHATHCVSCGHALAGGPFCAFCGEEAHDTHDLSLRHFFSHSVLHEFIHVDGKIIRTLRALLFRPGFLACEYFAGRRVLYVNPLRLLLTAAILFALFAPPTKGSLTVGLGYPKPFLQLHLSMLPPSISDKASIEENVKKLDVGDLLSKQFQSLERRRHDLSSEAAAEKFNRTMESYGEILSFCSVVPLALLTFVIYGRKRRYLVEHLVFALHLEAFLLLLTIFINSIWLWPVERLPRPFLMVFVLAVVAVTYGTQAWYLQNSLIRFFETGAFQYRYSLKRLVAWKTAFIALLLFLANSLFLSVVHTIGAAIALWRL
ncbi:MAG: DUF3667 domain-containing protein [Bryobacteraceae bacterium]